MTDAHRFTDHDIVATIERLLRSRSADATICPSDVARALADDEDTWRASMPRIREVAARLVTEGRLRVTQRGVDVEATAAKGPIRLGPPR